MGLAEEGGRAGNVRHWDSSLKGPLLFPPLGIMSSSTDVRINALGIAGHTLSFTLLPWRILTIHL